VLAQAVHPRARFEIAYVGVDPARAVVAPCALRRARATRRPVVVVADAVSVELGPVPPRLRAAPGRVGPPASFAPPPPAAVVTRRLLAGSGPGQVGGPLLHHFVPAVPGLPACQRRVLSQCAPRVLPEEAVYVLAQDPVRKKKTIIRYRPLYLCCLFRLNPDPDLPPTPAPDLIAYARSGSGSVFPILKIENPVLFRVLATFLKIGSARSKSPLNCWNREIRRTDPLPVPFLYP
jgi:hypothetical protein